MNDNAKAASILRQYAGELYNGHTIGGEWDGEHIKAEHDELIALADRLALAQGGEAVAYTDGHGMLWLPGERVTMSAKPIPLYAHPATSADRVAELEAQIYAEANSEIDSIANALPGPYYMDPPDGGSVSIAEQVRRMAADVEAARKQLAESREREGMMRGVLEAFKLITHARAALAAEQEKNDEAQ